MSSFTSKNVRDLYEAYNSVYVVETELFLNNILDTVTESVNELVNEGYDLSDYSWDEIYESFLENVLEPELQEVESFITQLNESSEELTKEEIESLLQERLGFLSGLANLIKGRKAVQAATQAVERAPKPSIIQAAPVKLKPTTPTPTPSSNPLYAPGVSSGRPTKPTITPPPGADKGSFQRFGDWLSGMTKKGSAPAKPPAPTQPPASKPPAGTPKPQQGQQGWPSIGLRDKVRGVVQKTRDVTSKVTQTLTPGPRTKAVLKYGALPLATIPLSAAPVVSTVNLLSGRPSGLQQLSGVAQGATGNILQQGARALGALGSPDAPGVYKAGEMMKQAGADTQAEVERKRKSLQGTGGTGRTGQIDPTTGKPIYNHYEVDLNDKENLDEYLVKRGQKWFDVDKNGKETEVTPSQTAIDRYNRLQQQNQAKPKPQPDPQNKPKPPAPPAGSPKPGERKPGESTKDFHDRLRRDLPPTAPAAAPGAQGSRPPAAPSVAEPSGPRNDRRTAPPAAPASPARQPAPQASPVAAYVKAAAAARKSGDPAEMAKVRDMGMEIWRKANPKLAAAADERARIRGTAQTDNPLMKDMRDRLPLTPSVQSPTVKKDLGLGQQSLTQNPNAAIAATPKPAPTTPAAGSALAGKQTGTAFSGTALSSAKPTGASNMSGDTVTNRTPVAYSPTLTQTKGSGLNPASNTVLDTRSDVLKKGPLKKGDPGWANNARYNVKERYDAYDLVLEYLLSEGHADTVSEANYIMLQMSAEHIQDIVEVSGEWFRGIFNSNNSAASRAQNTSPFNRQTQPLPSTTSPFAKPASYTDSGKLTPYGAGGGVAAEKGGKTRDEVMKQGAKNLENKKRVGAPDPNFGR